MTNKMDVKSQADHHKIGLGEALAIGIGGMVGGGIFAVLGLTIELAQGGATVAFFLAGIVSLLTAYSYAKLSLTFPHEGGTIEFINQGLGNNLLSGSLNILLWISYIVMVALYAFAFGSYAATFFPDNVQLIARNSMIVVAVMGSAFLNILSAKIVGKSEVVIVVIKLVILVGIVALGLHVVINNKVDYTRLAVVNWASPFAIIAGGFLIFLAYEGFELIANSAEDIKDPKRNLPRAYYISVIFVIFIYMLAGAVTAGVLPMEKIATSRDFALAEVAKVFMNDFGFNLVVVAAVLSTFSAIAATLYGNTRLTRQLSHANQFPKILQKEIFNRPIVGLLLTATLGMIVALLGDLDDISTLGSVGFLTIFFMVNLINFKLRKKTNSNAILTFFGMLCCLIAFVVLVIHAWLASPARFAAVIVVFVLSFAFEAIYLSYTRKKRAA
jgi:hypothetical protein